MEVELQNLLDLSLWFILRKKLFKRRGKKLKIKSWVLTINVVNLYVASVSIAFKSMKLLTKNYPGQELCHRVQSYIEITSKERKVISKT